MDWRAIIPKNTNQFRLRTNNKKSESEYFDRNGLADIYRRKVIACTDTFGNVGEEVEVTFQKPVPYWNEKGTLFAIIGDIKRQVPGVCDKWGHFYSNGRQCCVVEFVVDDNIINDDHTIKDAFPLLKKNPVVGIQKTGVNFL